MANPRVLLGFSSMSDHEVEETAGAVLAGLYANATIYPTPPVPQAVLQGKLTRLPMPWPHNPKAGPPPRMPLSPT